MGKRGKRMDPKTEAEIIQKSKDYSARTTAKLLGLHRNTVAKVLQRHIDKKLITSHAFRRHDNEVTAFLKYIIANMELLHSSLAHFKQVFPEFAHVNSWHDISEEDIKKGIFGKMALLSERGALSPCNKCAVCQSLRRIIGRT